MDDIKTLEALKNDVRKLLDILARNINDDYYPRNVRGDILKFDKWTPVTFDSPIGDATPFVELKKGQFNFVISELGEEYERIAGNADEILALIFEGVTSELASRFELANRVEGQDSRRKMFFKQIELLNLLNSAWASSKAEEHQKILQKYPFNDSD